MKNLQDAPVLNKTLREDV